MHTSFTSNCKTNPYNFILLGLPTKARQPLFFWRYSWSPEMVILLEVLLKPGKGYSSGGTPEAQNGLFVSLLSVVCLLCSNYRWKFGSCNCQTLTWFADNCSVYNCSAITLQLFWHLFCWKLFCCSPKTFSTQSKNKERQKVIAASARKKIAKPNGLFAPKEQREESSSPRQHIHPRPAFSTNPSTSRIPSLALFILLEVLLKPGKGYLSPVCFSPVSSAQITGGNLGHATARP